MITVTRLNGKAVTINLCLIETVEAIPDTVITLSTGNKFIVKESVDEVKRLAIAEWSKIGIAGTAAKIHTRGDLQ